MTRLAPALLVLVSFLALLSPTLAGMEPVGHIGGPAAPLFVQGTHAFVGMGPRVLVVDISTPSTPTLIGQSPFLMTSVEEIFVVDTMAYVIDATGLHLLDVSDLARPAPVGFYPMAATKMAKAGSYLYVGDKEHGIRVLDVSNPTAPTLVVVYEPAGIPTDLVLVGTHLYVVIPEGLEVVDISTATSPRRVGSYMAAGSLQVTQAGNTLYLITQQGEAGTLHVIDIAMPTTPKGLAIYPVGAARGIAAAGPRVYLVESGGVRVLDVSNPAAPKFLAYLNSQESIINVAVSSNLLYMTKFYTGLHLVDMTSPATPRTLGQYRTIGYPTNIALSGSYGYVPDGGGALHVVDLSTPLAPQLAETLVSPSFPSGIAISGTLAYVAESGGLRVLDISTPRSPTEVGYYPMPAYAEGTDYATGVDVRGDLAYLTYLGCRFRVGCGFGGIRILDISEPGAPRSLAAYVTGNAYDIAISGSYAYLVTGDLQVLDLSTPITPTLVGFYDVPGGPTGARGVEVVGDFVYVHHEGPGVLILNVATPTEPVASAGYRYRAPSVAGGLAVREGYVYLANPFGGLYVLEQSFSARGRVVDVHGDPVPGVTLASSAGTLQRPDGMGNYTVTLGLAGSVTLTPTLSGYTFAPPTRTLTLPPDQVNQDFTLVAKPVSATLAPGVSFTLRYTDTQGLVTEVRFPAAAVTQPTTIVLTPTVAIAPPGQRWSGHAFDLAAYRGGVILPDFAFQAPVTVAIRYSDRDLFLIANEAALSLQRRTLASWDEAAQSCAPPSTYQRNTVTNEIAVAICRVGTFALFGASHDLYLPLLKSVGAVERWSVGAVERWSG
ncbi:MAG: hypothetical protein H0T73_10165, partial [Ardenticatenales bacterium]|nr:hypothetical protein [Ardenticatenales bacterium]